MTVAELVVILQSVPQDLEVFAKGYEGGFGRLDKSAVRPAQVRIESGEKAPDREWNDETGYIEGLCIYREFIDDGCSQSCSEAWEEKW